MPENYKTTSRLALEDICGEVQLPSTQNDLSQQGKLQVFAYNLKYTSLGLIIIPYFLPLAVKVFADELPKERKPRVYPLAEWLGIFAGTTLGFIVNSGEILGYSYIISRGHPEILAIPLVANLLSYFPLSKYSTLVEELKKHQERGEIK